MRVDDTSQLELGELLNRVLDRGVVIAGEVTIAVANIDLVRVRLNVLIAAIETELSRESERRRRASSNADVPVLRADGGE